jgi:hypothetical protein
MAELDRADLIELLNRLGAQDDATALQAARELHGKLRRSGATWDDLLRPLPLAAEAPPEAKAMDDLPKRVAPERQPAAPSPETASPDRAETTRIIERLLARKEISANLREELTEIRRSLAEGTLDAMDSRYVRALAKRLGA